MNKDVHALILRAFNSINDAIACLNSSGKRIVFVCNEKNILLGTVTDGDIRKAIINSNSLNLTLDKVMNKKPLFVRDDDIYAFVKEQFRHSGVHAIPALNKHKQIVDIYFVEDFLEASLSDASILIMAGGFGTRMGPLTKNKPKPMLDLQGKPIIHRIVEKIKTEGFKKVYISVHYLAEQIEDYFKDGTEFGIEINYIHESEPLGTGGSLSLLPELTGPILVTNADVISGIEYKSLLEHHCLNRADATIATVEHKINNPFGVVKTVGMDFISFEEKPEWVSTVNAGIYVIESKAKKLIKKQEVITMPDIISRVKNSGGRVIIFPLYEDWIDLGNPEQYKQNR